MNGQGEPITDLREVKGHAPFYTDPWLTIYAGDCRSVLAELPDESVHCVVTSPPYWGLRDYGTATWIGGDEGCDHIETYNLKRDASGGLGGGRDLGTRGVQGNTSSSKIGYRAVCRKCGAVRQDSQLGLEPTPEEYVANLVAVFREVRRVLRRDGTLWLNLGDSYASGTIGRNDDDTMPRPRGGHRIGSSTPGSQGTRPRPSGMKPKDLVGIPWRVAFALQADGWYLRSDIIWSKPNPMPESVTDRPTKAHEYLFLLSKSARYYFDADAVREGSDSYTRKGTKNGHHLTQQPGYKGIAGGTLKRDPDEPYGFARDITTIGRNLRSVWTIPTRPYPGAHFAVFPPELPERCIKAGSPEGGVVLDPFAGSGTVGMVAQRLSRRAILIDLNPEYIRQQLVRNHQIPVGL